jgi:hypothetical protein
MRFLIIFLLIVIAVCAWTIFGLTQAKNRFKKHAEELSNEILRMSERGNKLKTKLKSFKNQNEDLRHQRESIDKMIKLGFLKVCEDVVISKDKIVSEMSRDRTTAA